MDPYIWRDAYAAELIERCAAVYVGACWLVVMLSVAVGCISAVLAYAGSRSRSRERERVEKRIARSIDQARQAQSRAPRPLQPQFAHATVEELHGDH